MEELDIYDLDRKFTGKTFVRGTPLSEGSYRLVVHICIFNNQGQMLIQKRTITKDSYPGLWDISLGGCATKGDDTHKAIHRELKEELGLDIDFSNTNPHFTINDTSVIDDYYLLDMDVDISKLKLQVEEVDCVKWADKDEIHKLIDEKKFITWELQVKYNKNDIETFLPTILNNPNYETEGCSEKYTSLDELKAENPQFYKES